MGLKTHAEDVSSHFFPVTHGLSDLAGSLGATTAAGPLQVLCSQNTERLVYYILNNRKDVVIGFFSFLNVDQIQDGTGQDFTCLFFSPFLSHLFCVLVFII